MILQVPNQTVIGTSKNQFVDKSTGELKEYYRATFIDKDEPVTLPCTAEVYDMLTDKLDSDGVRMVFGDVDFRVRQYRNKIDVRAVKVYGVTA